MYSNCHSRSFLLINTSDKSEIVRSESNLMLALSVDGEESRRARVTFGEEEQEDRKRCICEQIRQSDCIVRVTAIVLEAAAG